MNKAQYNELIENTEKTIAACESFLRAHPDIDKLTVKEYNAACTAARQLQSQCDHINKDEIYHVLGMGNLSASQLAGFVKCINRMNAMRSRIKYFAYQEKIVVKPPIKQASYNSELIKSAPLKAKK